jgi:hypothetical protein
MRAGVAQLRALKGFSRSVIVEPVLAGLEAIDDRMARGRVVLRSMLAWRSISSRCDRIRRIGADVATIRRLPGSRRSLYRLVSRSN